MFVNIKTPINKLHLFVIRVVEPFLNQQAAFVCPESPVKSSFFQDLSNFSAYTDFLLDPNFLHIFQKIHVFQTVFAISIPLVSYVGHSIYSIFHKSNNSDIESLQGQTDKVCCLPLNQQAALVCPAIHQQFNIIEILVDKYIKSIPNTRVRVLLNEEFSTLFNSKMFSKDEKIQILVKLIKSTTLSSPFTVLDDCANFNYKGRNNCRNLSNDGLRVLKHLIQTHLNLQAGTQQAPLVCHPFFFEGGDIASSSVNHRPPSSPSLSSLPTQVDPSESRSRPLSAASSKSEQTKAEIAECYRQNFS